MDRKGGRSQRKGSFWCESCYVPTVPKEKILCWQDSREEENGEEEKQQKDHEPGDGDGAGEVKPMTSLYLIMYIVQRDLAEGERSRLERRVEDTTAQGETITMLRKRELFLTRYPNSTVLMVYTNLF